MLQTWEEQAGNHAAILEWIRLHPVQARYIDCTASVDRDTQRLVWDCKYHESGSAPLERVKP